MYKDSKFKRETLRQIVNDRHYARSQQVQNEKAMERFRAVPYQLQYQRKYGGKKDVQI